MSDKELIARLRDACRGGDECKCSLSEAAAHISALTAQVADAQKEHEGWQSAAMKLMEKLSAAEAECAALTARVDKDAKAHEKEIAVWAENYAALEQKVARLEVALERIAGVKGPYGYPFPEENPLYGSFAVVEARAALAKIKEPQT